MEWYAPLTILPSIGLIIMSTSSQLMGLSSEIAMLLADKCDDHSHVVAEKKIEQLQKLTLSLTLLYFSCACFALSGIISFTVTGENFVSLSEGTLYLGTISFFVGLIFLVLYAVKAVRIRKFQFQHSLKEKP